jgi:hypothetical protein
MSEERSWVWFSTRETIEKEVPSVTAILETIIAVPLYWWIAFKFGSFWPLIVDAAVAPMVLLRSDQSVALGVKWFLSFERHVIEGKSLLLLFAWLFIASIVLTTTFISIYVYWSSVGTLLWFMAFIEVMVLLVFFGFLVMLPLYFGVAYIIVPLILSIPIRVAATVFHLKDGIRVLPVNFRRLVLCTSPVQIPEIVPGIETTKSTFKFSEQFGSRLSQNDAAILYLPLFLWFIYAPSWLYRLTIKSTVWLWWPLVFLGGDLKRVQDPDRFKWEVMGSLWAKTSIALACFTLLAFIAANSYRLVDAAWFDRNPLLTPIGYLLLVDWNSVWMWQGCALLVSVLSIGIVYLVDDVSWKYRRAKRRNDAKLLEKATNWYGGIELLTRVRVLVLLGFWGLVGTQAFLYANSRRLCLSFPPEFLKWTQDIYGEHFPRSNECLLLP